MPTNINNLRIKYCDGISEKLFLFCSNPATCTGYSCRDCIAKLKILKLFLTPEYWQKYGTPHFSSRLICLNKCFPSHPTLSQYRPIVVMSPLLKFVQAACLSDLDRFLDKNVHSHQKGFRRGQSIESAKELAFSMIRKTKSTGRQFFIIFVDLSSAFDRTNRDMLYNIIQSLPPKKLNLIKYLHTNLSVSLDQFSSKCSNGVPQGSTLSPKLFAAFTHPLMQKLSDITDNFVLFADDIFLIAQSVEQAQNLISTLHQWSRTSNMVLNQSKSGIIHIKGGKKDRRDINSISNIRIVDRYKYLGCWIDSDLDISCHLNAITGKILYLANSMKCLRMSASLKLLSNLFKLLVMPYIRLAMNLWQSLPQQEKNSVYVFVRKYFRSFCNLPKNTPNKLIYLLLFNIQDRFDLISAELSAKSKTGDENGKTGAHGCKNDTETNHLQKEPCIKNLPLKLQSLLNGMYYHKCFLHKKAILNSEHLRQHKIFFNPYTIIQDYQSKELRARAKSQIDYLITFVNAVKYRKTLDE